MRRTTMASFALAFMIGGTTLVTAQEPQQRRPRAEGEFRGQRGPAFPGRMLLRDIELSDQQKEQLKAVFEKNRPNRARSALGGAGQPDDALRQRMREAREKRDTAQMRQLRTQAVQRMTQERTELNREIRAILTPAQQVQFDKNVAAMKERLEERGPRRGEKDGAPRGERGPRPQHRNR